MGPGDKSPEDQAEEIINSSDENVDDLARGTEVFDESDAAAEEIETGDESDLDVDDNEF